MPHPRLARPLLKPSGSREDRGHIGRIGIMITSRIKLGAAVLTLAFAAVTPACGPSPAATGGGGAGGSPVLDMFDAGSLGSSGGGCVTATQYVYTLADDDSLYRFDPPTLTFTRVGVLDCPAPPSTSPFSMAVDRNGDAWSVFTDGSLYHIDTTNAHCTSTAYVPGQAGWTTFGMGFSADAPGATTETLYVSGFDEATMTPQGLGKIDLTTMKLMPIAMYDKLDAAAELTGTGDGKLFGAFALSPFVVAQIDKGTAQILSQAPQAPITYSPSQSNFAFAFWGGDFWLFVGPGSSTDVFHYQVASQTTTKVKTVSFAIVGAGVSTCAPIIPRS
jgi:hypothetical protein